MTLVGKQASGVRGVPAKTIVAGDLIKFSRHNGAMRCDYWLPVRRVTPSRSGGTVEFESYFRADGKRIPMFRTCRVHTYIAVADGLR